jgi:hypothetical protein
LSRQAGAPVIISGGARITPGITSTFILTDVEIPGEGGDANLAELSEFSLETNTYALLFGTPDFQALRVSGLTVNIVTAEDGETGADSVDDSAQATGEQSEAPADEDIGATAAREVSHAFKLKRLINFIAVRSEEYTNVNIVIDNRKTGFSFDFELAEMTFDHPVPDQRFQLASNGTVNGVSFELSGDYTFEGPFKTSASFGNLTLTFEGEEKTVDAGGGYVGRLDFQSGDIGDLLDVLKLDTEIEGSLRLTAALEETYGVTEVKTFSTALDLERGSLIEASGSIENLQNLNGVDIDLSARFYPEGQLPPPATRLAELRLTEARARLQGDHRAITVEDAVFRTNAFEETIDEFGPIGIGSMRRTPEGKLELLDVSFQAGPRDAPFITAEGRVDNALEGREFEVAGEIRAPVKLLLADLDLAVADQFGIIEGAFNLDDKTGEPQLTDFRLRTAETDLWSLDAYAASGDSGSPLYLEFDVKSGISDTPAFLGGLGLRQIDVSPVGFDVFAEITADGITAEMGATAGKSNLATFLTLGVQDGGHFVSGRIESNELRLEDLQDLAAIGVELRKSDLLSPSDATLAQETASDAVEVQPLVLPEKELTLEDLLAQEGVEPLVLPELTIADLLTVENILKHTDVDVGIEIRKLSGIQGVSSISSELVASGGKAKLGPIDVSYGGGFVSAQAQMDLLESPDTIAVSGSTGGWDFGKILDSVGAGIDAYGILHGNFNLTGKRGSVSEFVNSMRGAVKIDMSNGSISTSLLELAGLGVLPWLFSQERRERQTEISCLSAPVKFNAGRVSFDQIVAETRRVQVVAKGELNWRDDTISVRAEPRPVGRPLSRSAWPVNVTGKLSSPDIKPQIGGSFSRRADGADTMPAQRKPCVPDILQLQ